MFTKAFTELTLGLSDVLKVAPFTFLRYMGFFEWQDIESVIFLASLVVKKCIVCLTLSEKRTGKAAWVVAFFYSCRLLASPVPELSFLPAPYRG